MINVSFFGIPVPLSIRQNYSWQKTYLRFKHQLPQLRSPHNRMHGNVSEFTQNH